jgi:glycosyltransferase involved in cell wall biosynthesis
MAKPIVCLVTPVYNTEKYVAECIESVLAQTYENWQYLIVNNRSTDRTLDIAESYARRNSRITIHTNQEFLSLMKNWNHAMRQVLPASKYCKIVHADDWLFPECIERMVEVAEAHPSAGIVGAYRLDEDKVNLDGLPAKTTFFDGREICRGQLLGRPYLFGSPTSLLFRSDVVRSRDPFYDETSLQADKEACFDILKTYDFGFVHQVLTYTRRHNESITSFAHRVNTQKKAPTLVKYGAFFLSPQEYREAKDQAFSAYHRHLVRAFFQLKGKDFFRHHSEAFTRMGEKISLVKLGKAAFLQMLNMKETAQLLKGGIAARKSEAQNNGATLSSILGSTKPEQ